MKVLSAILTVVASLVFSQTVKADHKHDSVSREEAMKVGSYNLKFENWLKLANEGSANAQLAAGIHYIRGIGVSADPSKAFEWFLRSAKQGNPESQMRVSAMYNYGIGVEHNHYEALKWQIISANTEDETDKALHDMLVSAEVISTHIHDTLSADQMAQAEQEAKAWKAEIEHNH